MLGEEMKIRLSAQVLNLLLYSLRKAEPDSKLLEFLRVDEHLVDIGDDLIDYEVFSCPSLAIHRSSGHLLLFFNNLLYLCSGRRNV